MCKIEGLINVVPDLFRKAVRSAAVAHLGLLILTPTKYSTKKTRWVTSLKYMTQLKKAFPSSMSTERNMTSPLKS